LLNSVVALFNAGAAAAAGDYESIATVTVGSGGSANLEFTSIAADWTHLQLRAIGRTTASANSNYVKLQFNSDTGSNYAYHALYGDGTSALAAAATSQTQTYLQRFTGNNAAASIFGTFIVDILDYDNTNKYKTIRQLGGFDRNGAGVIYLTSGLWMSNNAITSIKLTPESGNFAQYSHFALYGIKGA